MRAPQELQATVTAATVKIQDDRLFLQAQLCLELPMPAHDADLPRRLAAGIEHGGPMLKRRLFQHAIEQADTELILARRCGQQGQGILCRGTAPVTFKTRFGTVKAHRRRIEHKADGTTEIPSAHAWQTPRQVALPPGLRDAACDGLLRDSAPQTVARIDTRAGEAGLLAKTTVLGIVPAEGEQLQAAAHARAEAVSARDPEALRLFVPVPPQDGQGAVPEDSDDSGAAAEAATPALIGFAGGPTAPPGVKRDRPPQVDPDVVLVELDEGKVHAQAHTRRQQILTLTAVVLIAECCWHLAAATPQELDRLFAIENR